jgi:hypothetical protein
VQIREEYIGIGSLAFDRFWCVDQYHEYLFLDLRMVWTMKVIQCSSGDFQRH